MFTAEDRLKVPEKSDASLLAETEAIRLAQQGDESGFNRIYELHSRRVFCLCLRMTQNRAKAEELTQEAFLQVFRRIQTFRGESAFFTWLHRLTANVVLMQFRKRSLTTVSENEGHEHDELQGKARREFGQLDLRLSGLVDAFSLQWAIGQLPRGYRMTFVLHDIEGYDHGEIAQMLGCSIGNSKSQLHKARMRLRRLLRGVFHRDMNHSRASTPRSLPDHPAHNTT